MSDHGVAVAVVTHESADDLPGCLDAVGRLQPAPTELVIVDCASTDGGVETARRHLPGGLAAKVVPLERNLGFAGGINRAIAECEAPWVLSLNPDSRPVPDFLHGAARWLGSDVPTAVGAVTGRLVRPGRPAVLDACGMYLTRTWRHLDRGSGEPERGQYSEAELVFAGTGAATLYSRTALEDVAVEGEPFLEEFHSYREDAEIGFRLQERGWSVVYEPAAVARHERHNVPQRRSRMSAAINRHSLKNRYLLRAYHQTGRSLLAHLPQATARDLSALAWVLLRERTSLEAYRWLWRHRRSIRRRRRVIQARRRVPAHTVERWFRHRSLPLPREST